MSRLRISSAAFALLLASAAFAQTDAPPPYVAVLDGDVVLVREAQPSTAIVNMPIVSGDRIMTTAGRVEVMYPDGAALDLDEGTTLDIADPGRVRLLSGRAILTVPDGPRVARYEIDTPTGTVVSRGPGKYRATANSAGNAVTSAAFEGWSDGLHAARTAATTSPSSTYLPEELRPYDSTLDQNGTWQYAATYGYVWYPHVDSSWRPYYEGTWAPVPSYGWTWVGVHRWEYPTHHYGRWGYANDRWFWIPGRAYSPAWVAWGYSGDYVSWCPLGIDSRPVFALTVSYGNPWTGWTVLSRSHFGGRGYVPRLAVPGHQLGTQASFVVQNAAPAIAVPRNGRPAYSGAAVPRSGGVGVPPTPTAPVPAPPQSVLPSPQTVLPTQQAPTAPPNTARPATAVRRGRESAPSAPATSSPAAQPPASTPPAPSTPPAQPAPPRNAPPPHGEPAQKDTATPPAAAAPRTPPPPKSGEKPSKPAEKAKGRGGL